MRVVTAQQITRIYIGAGDSVVVIGATNPTLSNASPESGSQLADTRTEAKHTPVSFQVNNPSNLRFVVWIKLANDERGHVVYDSVVGFLPPFNAAESKYDGTTMTVLQAGGWQDDPQWVCINGNGNVSFCPIRAGASGSIPPPHS